MEVDGGAEAAVIAAERLNDWLPPRHRSRGVDSGTTVVGAGRQRSEAAENSGDSAETRPESVGRWAGAGAFDEERASPLPERPLIPLCRGVRRRGLRWRSA